ncbi:Uncharacterised protein [Campylobacter hyointestinalis subsp. hyointestinalis]|nr:Uncharacterised protein [Campylobacter hyointestinalis subsp. hyointestinalis]CUU92345.1 Uncharacterised protein [Campylobacter hyointestinalis subsp. hyointestinalis]
MFSLIILAITPNSSLEFSFISFGLLFLWFRKSKKFLRPDPIVWIGLSIFLIRTKTITVVIMINNIAITIDSNSISLFFSSKNLVSRAVQICQLLYLSSAHFARFCMPSSLLYETIPNSSNFLFLMLLMISTVELTCLPTNSLFGCIKTLPSLFMITR